MEGDFQELPCWEVAHFVWMIAWGWRIHMREMFLASCLEWREWREVMSWYIVDGTAYTMTDIAQPESWSSSVIARGSAQSEPWDLGYYWPWWRWDLGGLLVGWYHERSVWDPGIERSLHIRVMQRIKKI